MSRGHLGLPGEFLVDTSFQLPLQASQGFRCPWGGSRGNLGSLSIKHLAQARP